MPSSAVRRWHPRSASLPRMAVPDAHVHLPNYRDGSLLNLVASLAAARGAETGHAPLATLPPERLADARNVVFFLIDGLGYNYLADVGRGGALAAHLAGSL